MISNTSRRALGAIVERGRVVRVAGTDAPSLGHGVYTFGEASTIVRHRHRGVTPRKLRSWMAKGLTFGEHETQYGGTALSFADLISLEMVTRFRFEGVSLQRVRQLEARMRERWSLERPFAHNVFFTDGASIWASLNSERDDAVEILGDHPDHLVWTSAIRSFASEIRFGGDDQRALAWRLSKWVEIDPEVQFGAPVVAGTRIPVRTIAANLKAGSIRDVAAWYALSVRQVEGVREFINS